VLWLFQRIAPRIGAARAAQWLEKFDYGNHNVSGPIEQYWVNGRLQISAPQQVAFRTLPPLRLLRPASYRRADRLVMMRA
jgi:beta-lactamase class D